jgi:hypothetical protein
LYGEYNAALDKTDFCQKSYIDEKAMAEIVNVVEQLEIIVSDMGVPILSGGAVEDYLCCVARGMIQFVCVRHGKDLYRSLTADRILIHPGSVMFKMDPEFIVAGEIIKTARMYASSVSPLPKETLERLGGGLFQRLGYGSTRGEGGKKKDGREKPKERKTIKDFTNSIKIAGEVFEITTVKGKKRVILPWESLRKIKDDAGDVLYKGVKATVTVNEYSLLEGEKLDLVLRLAKTLDIDGALNRKRPKEKEFNSAEKLKALLEILPLVLSPAVWKTGKKTLGFINLSTNGKGSYRVHCSRGFHSALNESLSSVETLIDELGEDVDIADKNIVNQTYRRLSDYLN